MSEEQHEAFLKSLKVNAGLQEKLKVAESTETVAAISREPGFDFSAEKLKKEKIEIPDGILEGLAGGGSTCFYDSMKIGDSEFHNTCER